MAEYTVGTDGLVRQGVERVKAKIAASSAVLAKATKHIEDQADALLRKGEDVMNHADKAFAPHVSMMEETDKGLEQLDAALAVLGNGGPLPSSTESKGA